ncbi:MAG: hypothetical protein AAF485_19180 [Chloroflexota bacterium]
METNSNLSIAESSSQRDKIFGGSLIYVAIRCTLQYIVLPFVLPLVGLSGSLSLTIGVMIDILALGMIGYNVWRLWNTHWRWRYLGMSVVMIPIIATFLYFNVDQLLTLNQIG